MTSFRTRKFTVPTFLIVGTLALGACSNSSDDVAAEFDSPLADKLGQFAPQFGHPSFRFTGSGTFEMSESDLQQQQAIENAIAECMSQEGFEYIPNAQDYTEMMPPELQDAFSLDTAAFVDKYGYGFTTLDVDFDMDEAMAQDPNTAIVDSLSESETEAYYEALFGPMDMPDPAMLDDPAASDAADEAFKESCHGRALSSEFGDMEAFDELGSEMWNLNERILTRPEIVEAQREWASCMADAGFPEYSQLNDPSDDVQQRFQAASGMPDIESFDVESFDPEAFDAQMSGSEPDEAELQELKEFEIDVARADLNCYTEHVQDDFRAAQLEVEEEFIAANSEQLDQLREQLGVN
ncbi:hypothetical protein IEU95_09280 [Hoyosella rhizosphaerae]|uniref:Uncharacterized protein n=1 Tax=Hoyosella rhizosphaerae TaxID=1755582 RepID=A0A916X8L2_9ACTN|nr:hypothetical protein [Hoyosella rhizosphaerae]MBN4927024.1 hypothetical protein [Hoyosella rhizosphaerae]GGC54654.1 hypothetical protein GCM10011410_03780 [Hoyosella rhizosphaerae]